MPQLPYGYTRGGVMSFEDWMIDDTNVKLLYLEIRGMRGLRRMSRQIRTHPKQTKQIWNFRQNLWSIRQ